MIIVRGAITATMASKDDANNDHDAHACVE